MEQDISFIFLMISMFVLIITAAISSKNQGKIKSNNKVKKNIKREVKELTEQDKIKLDKIAEKVKEKTKTNSYEIDYKECENTDIFESKFGGVPYWNLDMKYPEDSTGKKMPLLAQINLEKENFEDEKLPKKGILQFFIASDILNGLDSNGYKVIYHENINKNITKEDIEKLNIPTARTLDDKNEEYFPFNEEYVISFKKKEDYISSAVYDFDDIVKEIIKEELGEEVTESLYDYFSYEECDYLNEKFDTTGHKIFGYPFFTQCDPRDYKTQKNYDVLLLQIDSEGKIMWGDSGVANFFINSKDLEKRDFSDILYNWDCC